MVSQQDWHILTMGQVQRQKHYGRGTIQAESLSFILDRSERAKIILSRMLRKNIEKLVAFGRACAPPFFWAHFHPNRSAARPPPPAHRIAALLILLAIIWGQNYVPVRPYGLIFFWFFLFSIVFGSFLFVILFFFFSPFQFLLFLSLLVLLVGVILRLLILLLLYFNLFVVLQTSILMIYTYPLLWGVFRGG